MYINKFLPKPQNWVGLTMVNVSAVKMLCNCKRTTCKILLRSDTLIKTAISSSAATPKGVIEGL